MLRAEPYPWDTVSAPDRTRWFRISTPTLAPGAWITVWEVPLGRHLRKAGFVLAQPTCSPGTRTRRRPHSSRERPRDVKKFGPSQEFRLVALASIGSLT